MTKKLEWTVIILSLTGIIDTAYLSYARFTSSPLSCNFFSGCDLVTASEYSVLFGTIPLAYLGLAFYIFIFAIGVALLKNNTFFVRGALLLLTFAGFVSSMYFFLLQALVIEAFCIYCLISAAVSALLFFISLRIYRLEKEVPVVDTAIEDN